MTGKRTLAGEFNWGVTSFLPRHHGLLTFHSTDFRRMLSKNTQHLLNQFRLVPVKARLDERFLRVSRPSGRKHLQYFTQHVEDPRTDFIKHSVKRLGIETCSAGHIEKITDDNFTALVHAADQFGMDDLCGRLQGEPGSGKSACSIGAECGRTGQQGNLDSFDFRINGDRVTPGPLSCAALDILDRRLQFRETISAQRCVNARVTEQIHVKRTAMIPPGREHRPPAQRQALRRQIFSQRPVHLPGNLARQTGDYRVVQRILHRSVCELGCSMIHRRYGHSTTC